MVILPHAERARPSHVNDACSVHGDAERSPQRFRSAGVQFPVALPFGIIDKHAAAFTVRHVNPSALIHRNARWAEIDALVLKREARLPRGRKFVHKTADRLGRVRVSRRVRHESDRTR